MPSRPKNKLPNHFDLPHRLRRLADLAYNLWWTWQPGASEIFARIDRELWQDTYHNPVRFLRQVSDERLKEATQDATYLDVYDELTGRFDRYMAADAESWASRRYPDPDEQLTAYFSTEFGLHETLPIYAGGLGILSGDHLKEASDLGLPFVAVGFLYTQGYFSQRITEDGWQEATYADLSFPNLPVIPVTDEDGERVTVQVELGGRSVSSQLWRIQVGRVPLFLLDTNLQSNPPQDQGLTARLYTSDLEMRLAQEMILGIGGVRALRSLGYSPARWHMNEGHSAFMILELIREQVSEGNTVEAAKQHVREHTVFTTHTPVPAGHDEFPLALMDKFFGDYWTSLGLDRDEFMDLARHDQPWGEAFSMAILALRHAGRINGVSELHGRVARDMWSFLWPDRPPEEVPISHITNGVHTGTWIAASIADLFDSYLAPDWRERIDDPDIWEEIDRIPDSELWSVRRHLKRKLVAYARERVREKWIRGQIHPVQVVASGALLDPYALTIGFARRFATYKRADLILTDMDRLLELINRPGEPVQVIFAGKAHPADEPGKRLIQEVYRQVKRAENGGRLVFLEDYDMDLARHLLQGVDVWLNNPRRPNEASGTSGQKAALNGALNFSVLDGWWAEGYNGQNGWAIGEGIEAESDEAQDAADAQDLYRTLEHEIIPLYYQERSADGLPGEWLRMMKESMRSLAPEFSMRRMVKEYVETMYLPLIGEPQS
ncbi:MAG: alpha-glucan family phosphorylase [Anaerolineales bacterium]|nr:alpha-glucan family phosphorylase [Anaerolineales bacterium]